MEFDYLQKIRNIFSECRRQNIDARPALRKEIDSAVDIEDRHIALDFLKMACVIANDHDGEEQVLKEVLSLDRTIAASWIGLAKFYARANNTSLALEALQEVLNGCCEVTTDAQYAYTECTRVAAGLGEISLAEHALKLLLACPPRLLDFPELENGLPERLKMRGVCSSLTDRYTEWLAQARQAGNVETE